MDRAAESGLFHRAKQRVLVLACIGRHLRHLGLGDFVCEYSAYAFASGMDFQHNARGGRAIHAEEVLQDIDDEFHGSEIVVEQDDLVERRPLELRLSFLCDQLAIMPCTLFRHQRRYLNLSKRLYRGESATLQGSRRGNPQGCIRGLALSGFTVSRSEISANCDTGFINWNNLLWETEEHSL
jgi:hypothetical protein